MGHKGESHNDSKANGTKTDPELVAEVSAIKIQRSHRKRKKKDEIEQHDKITKKDDEKWGNVNSLERSVTRMHHQQHGKQLRKHLAHIDHKHRKAHHRAHNNHRKKVLDSTKKNRVPKVLKPQPVQKFVEDALIGTTKVAKRKRVYFVRGAKRECQDFP